MPEADSSNHPDRSRSPVQTATDPAMRDDELRNELLRMRAADLDLRAELVRDGSLFNGYNARMAALHRTHNARLGEILAVHGWPGRRLVGDDGAAAAWLLLQHAILAPDLMRSAMTLVAQAAASGDCDTKFPAYLTDRVRTLEGRPQIYGTQHDWDADGQLSPLPIEAPDEVDDRRRDVGLEPLSEQTHRLRTQAEAEGERPPADFLERRNEMDQWAKMIGWR